MKKPDPIIVWFGQDLRLHDNPALCAAVKTGAPIIPLYIADEKLGGASYWWLGQSLGALSKQLNGHLVVRIGQAETVLRDIMSQTGATHIFRNKVYEPEALALDKRLSQMFAMSFFEGNVLLPPDRIMTKGGTAFRVFTPYYQAVLTMVDQIPQPLPAPKSIHFHAHGLHSDIQTVMHTPHWAQSFDTYHQPGEMGAYAQARAFCDEGLDSYKTARDFPAIEGTSGLSAHLHFGEISPRQLWHKLYGQMGADAFLRQIVWREFAIYLLYHNPLTPAQALDPKFRQFPWQPNADALRAWQRGQTGYPIVDAGMRQLWQTGWMHNRVRMIVGSFLVKHLLQPWQDGAAWFADTLVDADLANNTMGWQWIAGCGADAAPYFRIFNPVLQAQKFDPDCEYVRRYVPELAHLPDKFIHTPWLCDVDKKGYPAPIIRLDVGRIRALAAYGKLKHNVLP